MVSWFEIQGKLIIRLQPNDSASGKARLIFVLVVGGTTLFIALLWSLVGAWLVLPFAGLEVLVLWWATKQVSRAVRYQQVITMDSRELVVESGTGFPEHAIIFARERVYFSVNDANVLLGAPELWLNDGQQSARIGEFLNAEDCAVLRDLLQRNGLMVCREQWWKSNS